MNTKSCKAVLSIGATVIVLFGSHLVQGKTPRLRIYYAVDKTEIKVYDTKTRRTNEVEGDEFNRLNQSICRAGEKAPHEMLFRGRHHKYRFNKLQSLMDFYEAEADRKRTVTRRCQADLELAAILTGLTKDLGPEPLYLDSLDEITRSIIKAGMEDKTKDYVMATSSDQKIMQILCLYDISADTIAIVDTLQIQRKERERGFDPPFFDYAGDYIYYPKRESVLRYNLLASTIDTIPEAYWPVIPYNSNDILVWNKDTEEMLLLNTDLSVRTSIKVDFSHPLDVYSIGEGRFVVSCRHYPKDRKSLEMKVVYLDFNKSEHKKLLEREYSPILGVELVD